MGAFLEVATRFHIVKRAELVLRGLAELTIDRELRLADCLSPLAAGFGVTAQVSVGYPYATVSLPWARLLWAAGFDGVRYGGSHHPALHETCFALFGAHGTLSGYGASITADIPTSLVTQALATFGFLVDDS